jgi:hypothetical protein
MSAPLATAAAALELGGTPPPLVPLDPRRRTPATLPGGDATKRTGWVETARDGFSVIIEYTDPADPARTRHMAYVSDATAGGDGTGTFLLPTQADYTVVIGGDPNKRRDPELKSAARADSLEPVPVWQIVSVHIGDERVVINDDKPFVVSGLTTIDIKAMRNGTNDTRLRFVSATKADRAVAEAKGDTTTYATHGKSNTIKIHLKKLVRTEKKPVPRFCFGGAPPPAASRIGGPFGVPASDFDFSFGAKPATPSFGGFGGPAPPAPTGSLFGATGGEHSYGAPATTGLSFGAAAAAPAAFGHCGIGFGGGSDANLFGAPQPVRGINTINDLFGAPPPPRELGGGLTKKVTGEHVGLIPTIKKPDGVEFIECADGDVKFTVQLACPQTEAERDIDNARMALHDAGLDRHLARGRALTKQLAELDRQRANLFKEGTAIDDSIESIITGELAAEHRAMPWGAHGIRGHDSAWCNDIPLIDPTGSVSNDVAARAAAARAPVHPTD